MAPTSPVRRMTRTRARAAAEKSIGDMNAAPKKAVAVTKAASARKAKMADETTTAAVDNPAKKITTEAGTTSGSLAAAPRRRVKITPIAMPTADLEEVAKHVTEVCAPTRTAKRSKKSATKTESQPVFSEDAKVSKPRTRKAASTAKNDTGSAASASKTRGRPRKATVDPVEDQAQAGKPVHQTRKRAESKANATKSTSASIANATAVQKKRVTFQDLPNSDKENQPLPTKRGVGRKETSEDATGLRARPIRKPALTNNRKKAARSAITSDEIEAPRALTPKKITQVARSSTPSDSEEDELHGEKSPIRDLSQSPKRGPLAARSPSPTKRLNFMQPLNPSSPNKTSIMSPPKRLPSSPFKNALKESPKRGEGIRIVPASAFATNPASMSIAGSQAEPSLQQSPKRGVMDSSIFSQSVIKVNRSPHKLFLSHSPARRLFPTTKQTTDPLQQDNNLCDVTDTAVSSHFRSSRSPEKSAKVHRLSDEELAFGKNQEIDFDESIFNIRSPSKLTKAAPSLFATTMKDDASSHFRDLDSAKTSLITQQSEELYGARGVDIAEQVPDTVGSGHMANVENVSFAGGTTNIPEQQPLTGNAAAYMLNSYKLRAEDDLSEDELQADQTPQHSLLGGRSSLSSNAIRDRLSAGFAGARESTIGFTPLATQLSSWLTSSPDKQAGQRYSMFSPLAAQHIPGEVQINRQSTPIQPKSSTSRPCSVLKKSMAARSSLIPPLQGSAEDSSYFADEMAAKDLAEQIEGRESLLCVEMQDLENRLVAKEMAHQAPEETAGPVLDSVDALDQEFEAQEDEEAGESFTDSPEERELLDSALLDFAVIAQEAEELATKADKGQLSSDSSDYGDENTIIVNRGNASIVDGLSAPEASIEGDDLLPLQDRDSTAEQVLQDEAMVTPIRPDLSLPRFINTQVSKVPLRPEGSISPIKMIKKRSRSLSTGPSSTKKPLLNQNVRQFSRSNGAISLSPERPTKSPAPSIAISTPGDLSFAIEDFGESTLDGIEIPDESDQEVDDSVLRTTPRSLKPTRIQSTTATPTRSPLKAVGNGVLHGAVVYVDVHTTEGADASGIFVELLTEMGAKCVREWKWNPRASIAVSATAEDVESIPNPAKIGITHVVYKDGGKRTLEKVRDSKGEVCCVGVGWVLDCERESKWLDESTYAVNPAILPRGGSRRRKSMEPRALINANGNLSATRGRSISAEMTKEMRHELVNTPIRQPLLTVEQHQWQSNTVNDEPISPESNFSTPIAAGAEQTGYVNYDPSTSMSPNTPYFMSQGAKLVLKSCPPKQSQQGLFTDTSAGFPVSGRIEDQQDDSMRVRLEAARRKTMNWRPRVASPLGK